jgi:CBS domain containing-hemolysin-like protein
MTELLPILRILLLFLLSVSLSAFFSGSETGFYRVTRIRLLLDALGGNWIARGLLWLTNNPSLFVGTTLIGNNVANYLCSLAIVLAADQFLHGAAHTVELMFAVVLSPVVFVYGELLPKNLYFYAPNLLLRRGAPLFFLATVLFLPISALLWLLGRGLQSLVGEAPLHVRLMLARKELQQVLQEGQEAGILKPSQRELAQSLFAGTNQPVTNFCTPAARIVMVPLGANAADVLRLARRHRLSAVPVCQAKTRQLAGYVRIIDLHLKQLETIEMDAVRPLMKIPHSDMQSAALIRMQSEKQSLAEVVDEQGVTVGLLYADRLTESLFRGS